MTFKKGQTIWIRPYADEVFWKVSFVAHAPWAAGVIIEHCPNSSGKRLIDEDRCFRSLFEYRVKKKLGIK